ncbi:MAG: glycosyltransferase, partial [Fimbriimonadaceae bacterium]|nr:glycosyltransferase [Chitinophagales bacterium]
AFVFPSLFEGFGIPVVEARYCNIPVICSNKTSIPEVAGEDAIYFDPDYTEDIKLGLMRFLERKEKMKLSETNRDIKEKFNWDITAEKLFKSVLSVAKETKHAKSHSLH